MRSQRTSTKPHITLPGSVADVPKAIRNLDTHTHTHMYINKYMYMYCYIHVYIDTTPSTTS